MMKRILGSEMTFAMTFSRPRFSVLQDPQIAAPASQSPFSSRWEPMVTTATQLLASPLMKSPLEMGHPLAADFFSAIAHHPPNLVRAAGITTRMRAIAKPMRNPMRPVVIMAESVLLDRAMIWALYRMLSTMLSMATILIAPPVLAGFVSSAIYITPSRAGAPGAAS